MTSDEIRSLLEKVKDNQELIRILKTRKWDDIYNDLDDLTPEDREEIELKVKIIGEILKARKDKGISQAELEAISGVKQSFIARLENNRMDPQLTTVLKILKPLGLTLSVVQLPQGNSGKEAMMHKDNCFSGR